MTTPNGNISLTEQSALLAKNVRQVTQAIADAAIAVNRPADSVQLVAVSKRQPASAIAAAHQAGLTDFGENYVQEALPKIEALAHLPLRWHYIGPLQSNKTAQVAQHFCWVHSVARQKIAQRLSDARGKVGGEPLNLCLQVNIDADPNKAGIAPADAGELAASVAPLPHVQLRGLMCILDPQTPPAEGFGAMAELFSRIRHELDPKHAKHWDSLSMGMSGDYHQAIASGATLVRVGTALFGARQG